MWNWAQVKLSSLQLYKSYEMEEMGKLEQFVYVFYYFLCEKRMGDVVYIIALNFFVIANGHSVYALYMCMYLLLLFAIWRFWEMASLLYFTFSVVPTDTQLW